MLRSSRNCECYLDPMNLVKINELSDKATWRYSNRSCQKKKSIRSQSCFENSKLSLRIIILIFYCWSSKFTLETAANELSIDKNTVTKLFKFCREIATFYFCELDNIILRSVVREPSLKLMNACWQKESTTKVGLWRKFGFLEEWYFFENCA